MNASEYVGDLSSSPIHVLDELMESIVFEIPTECGRLYGQRFNISVRSINICEKLRCLQFLDICDLTKIMII